MFASRLLSSVTSTLLKTGLRTTSAAAPVVRNFTTMPSLSPMTLHRQTQLSSSLISPTATTTNSPILTSLITLQAGSIFSNGAVGLGLGQRRWKARGNNYQPNTYKRKKTLGFMSRMRSKTGRVIIARRKAKGRWYLAH